jgi:hypothetical protein
MAETDILADLMQENQPGPPFYYDFYNTGMVTQTMFLFGGAFSPHPGSPQNYINPQNVEFLADENCSLIDTIF